MNTLESTAYDIKHLLSKLNYTDEIEDEHLYDKIVHYLEVMKKLIYEKSKTIDPAWIVNLGRVECEKSNSGDDINVPNGSVVFSKYTIPQPVQLGKNPFVRVSNGLQTIEFTKVDSFDLFYQIYNGDKEILERNPVYVLVGNIIYAYPHKLGLSVMLIPSDPRQCYIRRALTPPYGEKTPYTATELRKFTIWDELPASGDMIQMVVDQIITKDFAQNRQDKVDETQDGTAEN